MRIIYYTPPSTPVGYFWLALKAGLLAYAGLAFFYWLFSFIGHSSGGVFNFFQSIFAPLTGPLFIWSGLGELPNAAAGLYTIFLLMFTPALLNTIPMMRLKMEQLYLLDEAYGPVKKREHRSWFLLSAGFFLTAFFMRYIPMAETSEMLLAFINCTRVVIVLVGIVGGFCFLIVGWRLYTSWLKSPEAVVLSFDKKNNKKKSTHLKVAIDNTLPTKTASIPNLSDSDMGMYIALTAEIIQIAGRTQQMPTGEMIAEPIRTLQKAAIITRSGQFGHYDIDSLCNRTCALFADGKLKHMPNLKAALALYKSAKPAKLTEIASELKHLLELN